MLVLHCGRFSLSLERPQVMGVVNVTPDSFSDGGCWGTPAAAIAHAQRLLEEGADLLDIGGESTRPGAPEVGVEEELARVLPVVQALRDCGRPLSVDTRKPPVMRAVLEAGADMINDVSGFRDPAAIGVVAPSACAVCVMHMQGEPSTMQHAPVYRDVVREVKRMLYGRIEALAAAGVARERCVIDPGIGFGKTPSHNVALLRALGELTALGVPVMVGVSRKSLIGALTGRPTGDRLAGSVAAALAAIEAGARIVRVHDVAATRDAIAVWQALRAPT